MSDPSKIQEFSQFSPGITFIGLITNRLHISQAGNTFVQDQCLWGWRNGIEDLASGRSLEGEQLRFPPSNVRLASLTAPCLPFSDAQTRPATKGAHPLGIPTDLGQPNRPQISQKRLGFRLRSPHLFGEEPCPLRLQTVFSPTALRLYNKEGMALKILSGAYPSP